MWLWLTVMQATVWLGFSLLASRRVADRPARAHAVLTAGLVGAILTPVVTLAARGLGLGLFVGPSPPVRFSAISPEYSPPQSVPPDASDIIMALSLVVGLVLLLRLMGRVKAADRACDGITVADVSIGASLERAAKDMGLRKFPMLVCSPSAPTLLIWAIGSRPRIVLPEGLPFETVTPGGREAVLRHELGHYLRRDGWAALLADAVVALLWWHPLAWMARKKQRLAAEYACDDWALVSGCSAADYAETVLKLMPRVQPMTGSMAATDQAVIPRMRRILLRTEVPPPKVGCRWGTGLVVVTVVAVVSLALFQSRPEMDALGQPAVAGDIRCEVANPRI